MQKDPLISALVGALFLGAVVVVVLVASFEYHSRHIRKLQPQLVNIQNNRAIVNSLANDAMEYSKRNPSIDPILQSVGVKPGGKTAAK